MTSAANPQKTRNIQPGDMISYKEDVFTPGNGMYKCIGERRTRVEVISVTKGGAICKVINSVGPNADPVGALISRPVANLLRGKVIRSGQSEEDYKSGGHLEGVKDGKKVVLDNASEGGMSVGASHADGGIKGSVGTQDKPIEFEGEEIILTAPVASSDKKYEFDGQELTGREIASKINVDNGGVSFSEGGKTDSCKCRGKTYKFGGDVVSDRDIINYINFMDKPVKDRILFLNSK